MKDPDGFDLQIGNGNGLTQSAPQHRRPTRSSRTPAPFEPTGWQTVWLDHFSFGATNYKASASFYTNLLGWTPTYDEGSQNELHDRRRRRHHHPRRQSARSELRQGRRAAPAGAIDHISFGISPWDTDGVKAELEKRGLHAQIDTSSRIVGPDGT